MIWRFREVILVQVSFSYQTAGFPTEYFSDPHVYVFGAWLGRQLGADNDKEHRNFLIY